MKKIYKYPLNITDTQEIEMPSGSIILKGGEQFGELFIWSIVDPESELIESRTICIFGTGNELPYNINRHRYIDTIISENGLVWHIFEH